MKWATSTLTRADRQASELLHERFDIDHVTLQVMRESLRQHCN